MVKNNILLIFFLFLFSTLFVEADDSFLFSPKGVAEIHITLPDGMSIGDIQREVDTKAFMEVKNSSSSVYIIDELYSGYIIIEGRGNSTWGDPKKPYNIDLIDEIGLDNPSSLLGMPKHHKWCLVTYYNDKSALRIPLAFYLGQKMENIPYTPRLNYIELYVNGEYRGLYSLCEKIERDKNRVDVKKLTANIEDQEEPRISGGYIIEATPEIRLKPDQKYFTSTHKRVIFTFAYPKSKNVTEEQIKWIKKYIDEFESVLYGDDFKDEQNGFRKYIDEDSFIDWYLLNELAKNFDAVMYASVYLHKDRNGKLQMSAPWDFDLAFGNVYGNNCFSEDEFYIAYFRNTWFARLFEDENFLKKASERFDELMPLFSSIPLMINENVEHLEKQGCIQRNFNRWPVLGVKLWPNYPPIPETYEGELQRLTEWIESRMRWMYINFSQTKEERIQRLKSVRPVIRVLEPERLKRGESTRLVVTPGYSYVWTYNGQETILSDVEYLLENSGEHFVQLMDQAGNRSLHSLPISLGSDTDDNTLVRNEVVIYPNPVDKVLFINLSGLDDTEYILALFDMKGEVVDRQFVDNTLSLVQMNLAEIANGMYILHLKSANGSNYSYKVFVLH
ncbi:T9SS C-terminal target domain-containing protein [Paludibacter sp. 221]|uniref:CotH kinase family protein n=1 Tax=Paludibacter sp. 221 TaxID=2302939 RepID=UPI0013D4A3DF|nr:CotH kinase family protein [Paludibacter sp. 221]NDV46485.1 T9SS C-terminal target domain-containing protein [Paludibacter sp. 221]